MIDYDVINDMTKQAKKIIEDTFESGYKHGIAEGNINDDTFAERVNKAYQRGMQHGMDISKDYEQGLNDAWECVGKMERLLFSDVFSDAFGNTDFYTAVTKMSASEAMQKIEEYEKKKADEIKVGDELVDEDGEMTYIVTRIYQGVIECICPDGAVYYDIPRDSVKKTGNRYDVIFRRNE